MTVLVIAVVLLALLGAPLFAAMGAFAILGGASLQPGDPVVQSFAGELTRVLALATGPSASTLSTIPLFVFAGYLMAEAGTARRLVAFAQALVGWIPGGLALVTIVTCAIFTTFTGASGVTIIAIGGLLLPALLKEGYRERFALGLVAGTGSVGLLFPPALPLAVYAIVYGMSAQATAAAGEEITLIDFTFERFMIAGVVPGLVLVGLLGIYAMVVSVRQGVPTTRFALRPAIRATAIALPELLIPVVLVPVLLKQWVLISEAAAFTALYVLLLETVVYRDLGLRRLPGIVRQAMVLVGAIFLVIVAATALTDYFITARVPDRLYEWMDRYIESRWTFLLALNVLLLVVGCLMDIFSAIVVVVPLIAPAAQRYGIDPYHLGVVFLLNLEIGYLTPPVGLNLFLTSFRFQRPITEVVRASLPFMLLMLVALALTTYVPALTPIRSQASAPAAAAPEPAPGTPVVGNDGGVAIVWPDGAVWTPTRCEDAEIKEDPLAHADCTAMFKLYARCEELETELDRLDCRTTVREGGDPFTPDAGPEGEDGEADAPVDGGGAEGAGADAAPAEGAEGTGAGGGGLVDATP